MKDTVPSWVASDDISGIIARVDVHNVDSLRRQGLPIVDVLCSQVDAGMPQVETDDLHVAKAAFDHLFACGFRRFAFAGYRGAHYSAARLRGFNSHVQEAGCSVDVYETSADKRAPTLYSVEQAGVADSKRLQSWLASLRKPVGLMACHDIRGQQVVNACRGLQISVPDDIGVVGVDDDDTICPLSDPPLSSVRPDADAVGYLAAETLDCLMQGKRGIPMLTHVPPVGLVQRESTEVFAVEDREVARVCQFIRRNACGGINVSDVVDFSRLARRQLERRFRKELDRTPLQEITNVRIRRVKQLLEETDFTLDRIAGMVGFANTESISVVFKRETGMTPGAYRNGGVADEGR